MNEIGRKTMIRYIHTLNVLVYKIKIGYLQFVTFETCQVIKETLEIT